MESILADCRRSLAQAGPKALQPLAGTRLFVTGATGFVGSWLLATIACLNDDHGFGTQVTGIARQPHRNAAFQAFLQGRSDMAIAAADVRQLVTVPSDTDWILHAAGVPDSRVHAVDPIGTAAIIADGTMRVYRLADQVEHLRGVLHFSSGLVGGADAARIGANTVYREAKRYSEALCAAFRSEARLPVVVTRPFTFIGPFQDLTAPWAANTLLHAALHGQPLKLLGSGEAMRSYLYGSDMAVLALRQLVGGRSGETFDLGGIEPLRLIDLARMVVAQARRPLELRMNTGRETGASALIPDMQVSAERFVFRPAFSVGEAIGRTLAWHAGPDGALAG